MRYKNAICKLMLHKTRGIVFRSTDYGESSIVVRIYTEQFGIQSYIVNSVRKKHARIHSNIFQPLTPVDLVVYKHDRHTLQRIADIRPNPLLVNIPFDIQKRSMIFFLDEVLFKSIHEEEANPGLFDFIVSSIEWLDEPHPPGNDFHLIFLLKLSRFLGFGPTNNYSEERNVFNLREGKFQTGLPNHPNYFTSEYTSDFSKLINSNYGFSLNVSVEKRRMMIGFLLEYFELHIDGFKDIRSHKVLEQVWS
jgi:DNA repair protein RecO (recombination protein O)